MVAREGCGCQEMLAKAMPATSGVEEGSVGARAFRSDAEADCAPPREAAAEGRWVEEQNRLMGARFFWHARARK